MKTTRYCTVPALFNARKWFEKKFGDICKVHDFNYVNKNISKWQADMQFLKAMWHRGYKLLACVTFIFLWTVGVYYWYE